MPLLERPDIDQVPRTAGDQVAHIGVKHSQLRTSRLKKQLLSGGDTHKDMPSNATIASVWLSEPSTAPKKLN